MLEDETKIKITFYFSIFISQFEISDFKGQKK